jgi:hypothetical protein
MNKFKEVMSFVSLITGVLLTAPVVLFCCFVILLFSLFFGLFLITAAVLNPSLVEETNAKMDKARTTN